MRKGGSVVAWCVRRSVVVCEEGRKGGSVVVWCVRKGGRECCGVVCEEGR